MTKIQLILIFTCMLQLTRSAPEGAEKHSQLDDVIEHLKAIYNDVVTVLNKQFPNTGELSNKFINQANNFTKNVEHLIDDAKVQLDKNKKRLDAVLRQITVILTNQLANLKEIVGPNASARVDEITERLEKGFRIVYDNVNGVVQAAKPEHLYSMSDQALIHSYKFADRFLNIVKVVEASVENTLKETCRTITNLFRDI